MKEQYEEVGLSALNKGDVVHVSYNSIPEKRLFLGLTVDYISGESLFTEEGEVFHRNYSRFYLVEKAKKPLPAKLGAVVKHTDGWKFIRIGEDNWKGINPDYGISPFIWSDSEVEMDDWKEVA